MKKLTVYNVYLDDGKSVFRVTVPAASKKEAADYVQGNGDVVAINPAPVQGIDLHRLAFCLHWRCDLLRRVRPGAYRGRRWSASRSGVGLLALALIRVQRFRLHLIRLHGLRWRCSIRCVFVPPPEGSDSPLYRVVP